MRLGSPPCWAALLFVQAMMEATSSGPAGHGLVGREAVVGDDAHETRLRRHAADIGVGPTLIATLVALQKAAAVEEDEDGSGGCGLRAVEVEAVALVGAIGDVRRGGGDASGEGALFRIE